MNPPLPKASQGDSRSSRERPLWKVFLPLVLLVIPAGMNVGANYLSLPWSYWLQVAAAVVSGLVVLWVLVRVGLYARRRLIERRQQSFLRRQDPLFAAAMQIQQRVRAALEQQRQAGLGPYFLPWYLVLAKDPEQVEAFLRGTGLEFPPEMTEGLNLQSEQPDRWFLANQAVIIDTSAVASLPDGERQFDLLLEALARLRPREPLSGVVLLLGVEELADPQAEQETYQDALGRLRRMQRILALNLPVYLVATGLDHLPGFPDFFAGMSDEAREQILGWSEGRTPQEPFDQGIFRKGLGRLKEALDGRLLRRLGEPLSPRSAGRALVYSEELELFLDAARRAGESIFAANRYVDPLPFRGLYLAATGAEGAGMSLRAARRQAVSYTPSEGVGSGQAWFIRHLFPHKILPERGLLSRPRWVLRRNRWRQAVGVTLLALVTAFGGWWLSHSVGQASHLEAQLAPTLKAARLALGGRSDPATALRLGDTLLARKQWLEARPWSQRLLGAGRYAALADELGRIHRALYYRLFLSDYLRRVESALSLWSGEGNFPVFARALEEYVRWANPNTSPEELEVEPFVDFLGADLEQRKQIVGQFLAFRGEGGLELRRPVGLGAQELVARCLRRLRSYLNPALAGGQAPSGDDARWWLVFSQGLDDLYRHYLSLLAHTAPVRQVTYEQTQVGFDAAGQALEDFRLRLERLSGLVAQALRRDIGWVDAGSLLSRLEQAAWGWKAVERELALTRQAAQSYRRQVLRPLSSRLFMVQMLAGSRGYNRLRSLLQDSLGNQADLMLDPSWQVGYYLRRLLAHLADYRDMLASWRGRRQGWRPQAGTAGHLADAARLLRLELDKLGRARQRVMQDLAQLEQLASPATPAAAPGAKLPSLASLRGLSHQGGKASSRRGDMIQELLALYRWGTLQKQVKEWLEAGERIARYQAALCWQQLADAFTFGDDLLARHGWREIKGLPVFSLGEPDALVLPVDRFLETWRRELPPILAALTSPAQALKAPPELQDFLALNQALEGFASRQMPALRKAVGRFVRCVQQMDADPRAAWRQIRDTPGPAGGGDQDISWGALESLVTFARASEERFGSKVDMVVQPLKAVGQKVESLFRQAVVDGFQQRWRDILSRYAREGLADSFPFAPHSRHPLSYRRLEAFLTELEGLARDYRLLPEAASGPRAPGRRLYGAARQTVAQLASHQRREFIRRCMTLRALLLPPAASKKHKVVLHLVPGKIGRSLHWIRLRLGDGTVYDLSVYGTPKVSVPLPARGPISFWGLDVRKTPLSSWQAATVGLIQLPYAHGHTQDPLRKRWLVRGSLPAVDRPGVKLPFQLIMEFDQGLPPLPVWPEE